MSDTLTSPSTTDRERELGEMISAFNDTTQRLKRSHERLGAQVRQLREQLDQKNRELARRERLAALGEMAAGVAHEIRNPLAGIRLYAAVLERDLTDGSVTPCGGRSPRLEPVDHLDIVRKIDAGIVTLDRLVGDILLFAGNASPNVTDVALAGVISEVLQLASPRCEGLGAKIHLDDGIQSLVLRCDRRQVSRALLNLVLNALDAAGEGGHVFVAASGCAVSESDSPDRLRIGEDAGLTMSSRGVVRITVEDDGPGVPDHLMDKVFNPFFTTKDTGAGLGLAIVHRIAEENGGSVTVANRSSGGARFTLTLKEATKRRREGSDEVDTPGRDDPASPDRVERKRARRARRGPGAKQINTVSKETPQWHTFA